MARLAPISGFPEWTPAERVVEAHVIATLRHVFELHGFAEIETRAIEPLERLGGASEASKEVYVLTRRGGEKAEFGLHFDLTVPFARYVEERQGALAFPFRRYQIQKVWRGERPQEGRFREFYQADIDVVAKEALPAHLEAEVAVVMARALFALPLPPATMRMNDRRLVEGFYRGVGVADVPAALRSVDKLGKIGREGVAAELRSQSISEDAVSAVLDLAGISTPDATFEASVRELYARAATSAGADHALALDEGIAALAALVTAVNSAVPGTAVADLSIARGLDYYTGAVYETTLAGHEDLGSICSGGRYDSLVAGGGFPGVGMSIGVSRLVSRLVGQGLVTATRAVPTAVLVAVDAPESRGASEAVATALRDRGIAAEVSPSAAKFGKQIDYAAKRGIPFVWFPGADAGEVKDIRSGEQVAADAGTWEPPTEDLKPRIVAR